MYVLHACVWSRSYYHYPHSSEPSESRNYPLNLKCRHKRSHCLNIGLSFAVFNIWYTIIKAVTSNAVLPTGSTISDYEFRQLKTVFLVEKRWEKYRNSFIQRPEILKKFKFMPIYIHIYVCVCMHMSDNISDENLTVQTKKKTKYILVWRYNSAKFGSTFWHV